MGGVYNGEGSAINGVSSLSSWELRPTHESPESVNSATLYGMLRDGAGGVEDFSGAYRADGYLPPVFPGDPFDLTLDIGNETGAVGSAYCEQVQVDWRIEPQGQRPDYIKHQVWFTQSGETPLALGAASVTDSTSPAVFNTEKLFLSLDGGTQTEIRYMRLIMRAPGIRTVHSGTNRRRLRTRGAFDASIEYGVYFDDPADLPVAHSPGGPGIHAVKVYVTVPYFWDLAYLKMSEVPFAFDYERSENVHATGIKGLFSSHSGTMAGYVRTPGAAPATKWPFP